MLSTSVINIKQRLHLCDYTIGVGERGQSWPDESIWTGKRRPGAIVTLSSPLRRLVSLLRLACLDHPIVNREGPASNPAIWIEPYEKQKWGDFIKELEKSEGSHNPTAAMTRPAHF